MEDEDGQRCMVRAKAIRMIAVEPDGALRYDRHAAS